MQYFAFLQLRCAAGIGYQVALQKILMDLLITSLTMTVNIDVLHSVLEPFGVHPAGYIRTDRFGCLCNIAAFAVVLYIGDNYYMHSFG